MALYVFVPALLGIPHLIWLEFQDSLADAAVHLEQNWGLMGIYPQDDPKLKFKFMKLIRK